MAKSKKGPGRPRKVTGKVFPKTKPTVHVSPDTILYPAEDAKYHRTVTQERYNKAVLSIARLQPNQAITVPVKDIAHVMPVSFAQTVKKIVKENLDTRNYVVKTELAGGKGDSIKFVRFYRVK